MLRRLSLALVALALTACASLTFDQRLQDGYALNATVRDVAASGVNAGRLTSAQGQTVLEITDRTRALLDTARDGDERGLDLALEVLEAINRSAP